MSQAEAMTNFLKARTLSLHRISRYTVYFLRHPLTQILPSFAANHKKPNFCVKFFHEFIRTTKRKHDDSKRKYSQDHPCTTYKPS